MASQQFYDRVNEFCDKLKQRKLEASLDAAKGTAELMRQLVTSQRLPDPHSLLAEVKNVGLKIQAAKPIELSIGNIVRRVMHIIREEMEEDSDVNTDDELEALPEKERLVGGLSKALRTTSFTAGRALSLHNLLDQGLFDQVAAAAHVQPAQPQQQIQQQQQQQLPPVRNEDGGGKGGKRPAWGRKHEVIEGVNELIDELKDIDNAIANQAVEHIHANEVILTFGYSRTVLQFLKRAKEKRDFQVVVAEAAPTFQGHQMALELAEAGIQTTAINDSAVYAMMARVNKVVVSSHALLANGGVMAPVGMLMVAMAAKRHSIPCVVLVGIYKLAPMFPHEPGVTFNDFKNPADILPYQDLAVLAGEMAASQRNESVAGNFVDVQQAPASLQVHNPSYDYVPPELISLFITDHGHGFMPSYVYRLLAEFYHRQDYRILSNDMISHILR